MEAVPVTKEFRGNVVGRGFVQVFELIGHPITKRAYAWTHPEGEKNERERFIVVLEIPPAGSAKQAVQAAIVAQAKQKEDLDHQNSP